MEKSSKIDKRGAMPRLLRSQEYIRPRGQKQNSLRTNLHQMHMFSRGVLIWLKLIKIAAHLIQSTVFHLENDGNIDFLINRKTGVQEPVKDSGFSRRDFSLRKYTKFDSSWSVFA